MGAAPTPTGMSHTQRYPGSHGDSSAPGPRWWRVTHRTLVPQEQLGESLHSFPGGSGVSPGRTGTDTTGRTALHPEGE